MIPLGLEDPEDPEDPEDLSDLGGAPEPNRSFLINTAMRITEPPSSAQMP